MRYRNNLSDVSDNSTLTVTEPFTCYVEVGFAESNTYIGRSQALGRVFAHVQLPVGALLQDLHGGVFAELGGVAYKAVVSPNLKHPFEKVYLPREEQWPVQNLSRGPYRGWVSRRHEPARYSLEEAAGQADRAGHGIDWVLRHWEAEQA